MTEYITSSLLETQKVASDLIQHVLDYADREGRNGAVVLGLYGGLGAGKTSLTQGLARAFGITESVISPTFVLEKIYEIDLPKRTFFHHLIHIDAYRLESFEELLHLGWNEIISDIGNIIVVEWPERVTDIMPVHIEVRIEHAGGDQRKIEIVTK